MLLSSSVIQHHYKLKESPPNARINPPEHNCDKGKLTMRSKLIPVGLNELLDLAFTGIIQLYLSELHLSGLQYHLTSILFNCTNLTPELTGREASNQASKPRG
jgi:hypothetical protein